MIYSENVLICLTIPLLITVLFLRDTPRKVIEAFILGMIICLVSGYISGFAKIASGMSAEDTAIYVSPMIEETMKLLPVLFTMYVLEDGDSELFLTSVASGAGFATFENICYLLSGSETRLSFVLIRGFAVGTMHIASMILLAATIIVERRYDAVSLPALAGALAMSSTLHGLYNLLVSEPGLFSAIGYAMPFGIAVLLYIGFSINISPYLRGEEEIKK